MQYFIPFAKEGINKQIELAIMRADKHGVKVISLAALNKVGVPFSLCTCGFLSDGGPELNDANRRAERVAKRGRDFVRR